MVVISEREISLCHTVHNERGTLFRTFSLKFLFSFFLFLLQAEQMLTFGRM